jgi:hypothetical protein
LNRNLMRPTGRVGCIVPSGIATDDTTKFFFQNLAEAKSLVSLLSFFEIRLIFPDTDSRNPFCLLTLTGLLRPAESAVFVFDARSVDDLSDPVKRFALSPSDLSLLNPNTRTCPVFRTARDAELTKAVYRRIPVLLKEGQLEVNPWGISFLRMLDMANDSGVFRTAKQLLGDGYHLTGNVFRNGNIFYLPLYEAKMTNLFDHRHGSITGSEDVADLSGIPAQPPTLAQRKDPNHGAIPRYWVPSEIVDERVKRARWPHCFFISFRDVARATDSRTAIHAVLPRIGVGHKAPLILPFAAQPGEQALLLANLNSYIYDYLVRQKIGGASLSYFIVKQLPVLLPAEYAKPCLGLRIKRWPSG